MPRKRSSSQISSIFDENRPKLGLLKKTYETTRDLRPARDFETQNCKKILKFQYSEQIFRTMWNSNSHGTYFYSC